MPIKFVSHVDEDKNGNWFIKLSDTVTNNSAICKDLDEYKIKLEEFSQEYGFDIEVVWTKSKSLSPKNYEELNEQMALLQEEYQKEIEQLNEK